MSEDEEKKKLSKAQVSTDASDEELEKLAQAENRVAQYFLACRYHKSGNQAKVLMGIEYLSKSASEFYPPALYKYGKLLIVGKVINKNTNQGICLITQASDLGYPHATLYLAKLYETGTLVRQDFDAALSFYKKAAENGDPSALNAMGSFYEKGLYGLRSDEKEAINYYQKAANLGNKIASYNLSILYRRNGDTKTANHYLQSASDAGIPQAQFNLALTLNKTKEKDKRNDLFKISAHKGLSKSQYNYGIALAHGDGVKKDETEALRYLKRAAEHGNSQAQLKAGKLLLKKDPEQSRHYLEAAVEHLPEAQQELDNLCATAKSDDPESLYQKYLHLRSKNGEEAYKYLNKSADAGHRDAMIRCAVENESGQITPISYDIANRYYTILADKNDGAALNNLGRNYELGRGFEQDQNKAKELYKKSLEAGNVTGGLNYARMLRIEKPPNLGESARILAQLAKQGKDPAALYHYGKALYFGQGVEKNLKAAARYIGQAASLGHLAAAHNYGVMLYYGEGIAQDIDKAVTYFQRAAALEKPQFKFSLAQCLRTGFHAEKNEAKAAELYEQGAKSGFIPAVVEYALLVKERGEPQRAAEMLKEAASRENIEPAYREAQGEAQYHYAVMLRDGWEGTPPNPEEAKLMFQAAAMIGNPAAVRELK